MDEAPKRYRSVIWDSARWEGFEFRDDDIVISTPPKSGTTWMQMICALLVFQDPHLPAPLTELSPWVDMQTDTVEHVFAALAGQTHRRFIKSHTPFDGLPHDERVTYICVGRDPRDVGLSWDNHTENMNVDAIIGARAAAVGLDDIAELMPDGPPPRSDDPVGRFWTWIDNDTPVEQELSSLRGTLHHLDTFWEHREDANVVMFHYADLQADLDGEMRRLAAALGITVDEGIWPTLVAAATFANMKGRADELAPQVKVDGFWKDNSRFFNRGSTGQWQSIMDADGLAHYAERMQALAPPDLAAWAQSGWQGPPEPR
jgi:aryl sulfotransferase